LRSVDILHYDACVRPGNRQLFTVARLDTYDSPQWLRVVAQIPAFRRLRELTQRANFVISNRQAEISPVADPLLTGVTHERSMGTRDALIELERQVNRILAQATYA
jgi:hypothetical protein